MSRPINYATLRELRCTKCDLVKSVDHFHTYSDKSAPLTGWRYYSRCKECNKIACRKYGAGNRPKRNQRLRLWRRAQPEKAKANDLRARLKAKYGLTVSDVKRMRADQNDRCKLCQRETVLVVDHCHKTGRVRGLLCNRCNTSLGWLETHPGIFLRAPGYIAGLTDTPRHGEPTL